MLKYALAKQKFTSCTKSDEIFLQILNKHAPLKRKILRQNYTSFISKPLRKVIVNSSYLENLYFKKKHRLLVKKLQIINLDSLHIYQTHCIRLSISKQLTLFSMVFFSYVSFVEGRAG